MICLSIETTGKHLGLGLYEFEKTGVPRLLIGHYEEAMSQQTEQLIPTLDRLMKRKRIERRQLSLVAVDVGPGSFTGVRVGLAAGRMIAQALEIPIIGVSSLEAMALPFRGQKNDQVIVPVLTAVAGEVYFAAYKGPKTLQAPAWKTDADLAGFLTKHKNTLRVTTPPHPDALADIAIHQFQKALRKKYPYERAVPMYLLPSWAERSKRSV